MRHLRLSQSGSVEPACQATLFPECLEDWIDEDNPIRVVDAFVDKLDLSRVGFDGVVAEATGRPSYHPAVQTCLIAGPLSLRKSAIVLWSGMSRPVSHITSTLRPAADSASCRMGTRTWLGAAFALLSTAGNGYDADYFGDTSKFSQGMRAQHRVRDGENWDETIFNVFRKKNGAIRHFWGSEMSFAPPAPKQHHRAGDLVDPLWGLLDMTPDGRADFFPKVNYDDADKA